MQQRLTIITLGVKALKSAADFYENIFGWIKTKDSNEHITFFKLNGILLSLYEKEALANDAEVSVKGNGFKGFGLSFNTHSIEEVDDLINDLSDKGVKVIKQPHHTDWGGYSGYVADLDDNLWEIAYNPFIKFDENGNVL